MFLCAILKAVRWLDVSAGLLCSTQDNVELERALALPVEMQSTHSIIITRSLYLSLRLRHTWHAEQRKANPAKQPVIIRLKFL